MTLLLQFSKNTDRKASRITEYSAYPCVKKVLSRACLLRYMLSTFRNLLL